LAALHFLVRAKWDCPSENYGDKLISPYPTHAPEPKKSNKAPLTDRHEPHNFNSNHDPAAPAAGLKRCAPSQARRFLSGERPDVSKPSQ
jgi:hypothetical protein